MDTIYYVVDNLDTITYVEAETQIEALLIAQQWVRSEIFGVEEAKNYTRNFKDHTITDSDGVVHDLINESHV